MKKVASVQWQVKSGCFATDHRPLTTDRYSYRSASIGLMREAFSAG